MSNKIVERIHEFLLIRVVKYTLEMEMERHQMILKVCPVKVLGLKGSNVFEQLFSYHYIKLDQPLKQEFTEHLLCAHHWARPQDGAGRRVKNKRSIHF